MTYAYIKDHCVDTDTLYVCMLIRVSKEALGPQDLEDINKFLSPYLMKPS